MQDRKPNFLRPANLQSPSGKGFWEGAREGRLLAGKCSGCGEVFFPPRLCCPKCLGADLQWMELEKRGTLHSWTEVFLAGPEFDTPFLLGLVDLAGGIGRLMARITGVEAGDLQIGMAVKIGFVRCDEGFSVYCAEVEGKNPR